MRDRLKVLSNVEVADTERATESSGAEPDEDGVS